MWGDIGYLISPSNLSHLGRIRVAIVNHNYIQRSMLSLTPIQSASFQLALACT